MLPPPGRAARHRRRTSPWPLLVLLLALLAIGAVVAFLVLRGSGSGGGATPPPGSGTVALAGIGAYDPYGTGTKGEHDSEAPRATDHDGATYWRTERYHDAPSLNKPGVGLVLDAGKTVQLHELRIATSTPGFVAIIKGGDSPTSFTADVSPSETVQDGTAFRLSGSRYRYYEIWITRLGPGYDDARINEVSAT